MHLFKQRLNLQITYQLILQSVRGTFDSLCVFCWRYFDWYFQLLHTIAINTLSSYWMPRSMPRNTPFSSKNLFVFTKQMDFTQFWWHWKSIALWGNFARITLTRCAHVFYAHLPYATKSYKVICVYHRINEETQTEIDFTLEFAESPLLILRLFKGEQRLEYRRWIMPQL